VEPFPFNALIDDVSCGKAGKNEEAKPGSQCIRLERWVEIEGQGPVVRKPEDGETPEKEQQQIPT
jgi:hypothetical protein